MIRRAAEAGAVHPAQFGGGVGLLCTCLCCLFAWRYASVPYLLHDSGWLYLQKRPSCCTYTIALSRSSVVWTTEQVEIEVEYEEQFLRRTSMSDEPQNRINMEKGRQV